MIVQRVGEGLLGSLDLLELFDEVIDLGLMGVGDGFLELGIVLDELIELFLEVVLFLQELGIVGILREGVGELALFFGEDFEGLGEGLVFGGVFEIVGDLVEGVDRLLDVVTGGFGCFVCGYRPGRGRVGISRGRPGRDGEPAVQCREVGGRGR